MTLFFATYTEWPAFLKNWSLNLKFLHASCTILTKIWVTEFPRTWHTFWTKIWAFQHKIVPFFALCTPNAPILASSTPNDPLFYNKFVTYSPLLLKAGRHRYTSLSLGLYDMSAPPPGEDVFIFKCIGLFKIVSTLNDADQTWTLSGMLLQ